MPVKACYNNLDNKILISFVGCFIMAKYKKPNFYLNSFNSVRLFLKNVLFEYMQDREITNNSMKIILLYSKVIKDCLKDNNDERLNNLEKLMLEKSENIKNKKIAKGDFVVLSSDDE